MTINTNSRNILNNTPLVELNGINDQSIVPLLPQQDAIPIHLPLFYLQTQTGPTDDVPLVTNGGELKRIFGDATTDQRQEYYNHATALAEIILAKGNPIFVKRITRPTIDPDTQAVSNLPTAASAILVAEIIENQAVHPYIRDADGFAVLDNTGKPTFDTNVTVVAGVKVKLSWIPRGSYTNSTLSSPITVGGSQVYPLLAFNAAFVGALGNYTGVRLWKADVNDAQPGDTDVIADQEALIYNAQLMYKAPNTSAVVVRNALNEAYVDFCFKPQAYNFKTNEDLTVQSMVKKYSDDGTASGTSPLYGPLDAVTLFRANVNNVFTQLFNAEVAAMAEAGVTDINGDGIDDVPTSKWMIDPFTGYDNNGRPHYGFQMATGSAKVDRAHTAYLSGGNDGDLTVESFELEVISQIKTNYQNPAYPLIDSAKFPFSCVYDSGFSTDGKKALFTWMGYRKDVHVAIGTHVYGAAPLTVSGELSSALNLRTAALAYAESDLWGTPACRAILMMESGFLTNSSYTERVSTIFDLAAKRATYLGAGSGTMKNGEAYDEAPRNQVTTMKNLSQNFLTNRVKNLVWVAGLNYAQAFDMHSYFYPALQTIYGIQQSIVSGELLMQICCDVQKQSEKVWRLLTGNSTLSNEEFIKKSNELLLSLTAGRYDNRVTIVPNTYFSAADEARGFSWTMDVAVYGNVPKTVAQVNVITRRQVTTTV